MTEHFGSLHWDFTGSSLIKFLSASNGDEFASKTFNAGAFAFQCKVYPNGRKPSQEGCVMLYFVLQSSFRKKIKQITVKARLNCAQTLCDWKHIQHLAKDNAGIGWHSNNMLLSEARQQSHLEFVCEIDIVRIEYKSTSNHSHLISASLNIGNNIYHKLSQMNVYTKYEWDIYPKLLESFLKSHNGKFYHSPDYNHGCWCISIAPNGANAKDIGNVKVGLQLLLLPPGISKIKTKFCIYSSYNNIKCEGKREFHYSSTFIAWGNNTMKTADLQDTERLSFVVEIVILKVFDEANQEVHKSNWFQYGILNNLIKHKKGTMSSDACKTMHSSSGDIDYNLLSPSITQISVAPSNEEEKEVLLRPKLNNNYSTKIHENKTLIDSHKNVIHQLTEKLDEIEVYKTEDEKHLITMEKTIIALQKSQHRLQQQQFEQTAMLKQYINDMSITIQRLTNEVVFMKNKVKKIENEQMKFAGFSPRSRSSNKSLTSIASKSSKNSKKNNKSRRSNEEKRERGTKKRNKANNTRTVQISAALATWIKDDCGLPQYVKVFAENGFDHFEIVKEMSKLELEDIGITLKGHQFKIMREIKKLQQTQKHHRAKETMDILHIANYLTPVTSPAGSDSNSPKLPPVSPTNEHSNYSHSKLLLANQHSRTQTADAPFINFGPPIKNQSPSGSASVSMASYTSTTTTNGYMQWTKHQKPMLLESPSSMNNVWNSHNYHAYHASPKAYNHHPKTLNLRPTISNMWECKACHNSNEGTLEKCEFCQHQR